MQIASSAVETNTESASAWEYTAAVAMVNRRQVRITLHAISPRFAMSILLKCAPLRLAPFILRRCRRCLLLSSNPQGTCRLPVKLRLVETKTKLKPTATTG